MSQPLDRYQSKRDFTATAEPKGDPSAAQKRGGKSLEFVIQKHAASHLHFDLRLELDGVMKSWAVPKGPSLDPNVKRLAMEVEDHPIEYNSFEGTIPHGQYGGGTVMLWDRGTYTPDEVAPGEDAQKAVRRGLRSGKLSFSFQGSRLHGSFSLVRTKPGERAQWLLFKHDDSNAQKGSDVVADINTSVESGRTMEEIATSGSAVWHSNRLGEDLEAVLDAFESDALQPMIARQGDSIGEGMWAIEPECNGLRVLALLANGTARIIAVNDGRRDRESGELRNSEPGKLVEAALLAVSRRREGPLVLDGFLVDDTPPQSSPFQAIDILIDDTSLLIEEPYLERRERLERVMASLPATAQKALAIVPAVIAEQDELPQVQQSLGGSAIVAKRIDSPYEPGSSEYWLRIQHVTSTPRAAAIPVTSNASHIPVDAQDVTLDIDGRDVQLTNLRKPFWPDLGITKGDLLRYYEAVSPYLLPHLRDRAMVMKRYPHGAAGEFFFMKRAPTPRPEWIETCSITHASKSVIDFPMVQDLASLLWVINLGCIDLNPWYSRCSDIDRPDFLHFDLDPVPDAGFERVRETALLLRELLQKRELPAYAKTSGSKGIHVYIPIKRGPLQKQVWTIAKKIAQEMEQQHPDLVTAEYRIANRPKNRVLVDYNQNAWGRTLASIYSVRPRPTATVSVPITWEEIEAGITVEDFTMQSTPARLERVGDLWAPVLASEGRVALDTLS